MKNKWVSQVFVAVVCALLGFFLTYQFKLLSIKSKNSIEGNINSSDIVEEVENLKKEKTELEKQNKNLFDELQKIENDAAESGSISTEMKNQLEKSRMIMGSVDVKGPGVVLTITPKSVLFNADNADYITDQELIHLVNLLNYSGAEAISINNIRITPQTGIKYASNYIWVGNNDRVSPKDKIVINAIGDKTMLEGGLNFVGALDYGALSRSYDKKISPEDVIEIQKSTQKMNSEYLSIKE